MNAGAVVGLALHPGRAEAEDTGAAGALAHYPDASAAEAVDTDPRAVGRRIAGRRRGVLAEPAHGVAAVAIVLGQGGDGAGFGSCPNAGAALAGALDADAAAAAAEDARAAAQ